MHRALVALALVCAASCGDRDPKLSVIQEEIFNRSCTFSSCHGAAGRQGEMVLDAGQAYANLVNVEPYNDEARYDGFLRVVPRTPRASFIVTKLTKPVSPDYEDLMPKGSDGLPQRDIDLIVEWIKAGARDD
jgi:hypothetical protein